MKVSALDIAAQLGFYERVFVGKDGNENPKRTVLKTQQQFADVRLAAFRKITGVKPISIKNGNSGVVAIFSTAALEKVIAVPNAKR